jgi:hypothetical protein
VYADRLPKYSYPLLPENKKQKQAANDSPTGLAAPSLGAKVCEVVSAGSELQSTEHLRQLKTLQTRDLDIRVLRSESSRRLT